jgi:hypothetical protein
LCQSFGISQDVMLAARKKRAANSGYCTIRTAVAATFGDLENSGVSRSEKAPALAEIRSGYAFAGKPIKYSSSLSLKNS